MTKEKMPKSVIIASLVTWAKNFFSALRPFVDARVLVLIVGAGTVAWLVFPSAMKPIIASYGQFAVAFLFFVGIVHLSRKILLSKKFDLAEHAELAKTGNIASAIVYAATLLFLGMVIVGLLVSVVK